MSDTTGTALAIQEEPRLRTVGNVVRPVMDPTIHVRNHPSLLHLDQLVQSRTATPRRADASAVSR